MATPTPSSNTPSKHLPAFSSPAPRSVPHTGAPNMLSFDSPAVLNMLTDASSGLGGVGMGISMSGLGMSSLGMTASSMGRADEAERSRRLRAILDTIASKPGRVSEQGLLALCKSLGLGYEKHAGTGIWTLLIGNEVMCDVVFKNDKIEKVELQTVLDDSKPDLNFGATGSRILIQSLRPLPGQSRINITLERFAESLQKLLTLDQLGAQNGGVSCFEAVAGVYTSLRKLFEHEKKAELEARKPDERFRTLKAEREVLCKKSGRPRLNGGSCLGLSLEYWMDRRQLVPKTTSDKVDKGKDRTEYESQGSKDTDHDGYGNTTYALTIECETSPSTLYNPIRISSDWIGDQIVKAADAGTEIDNIDDMLLDKPSMALDWLDPKPTYLEASAEGEDSLNIDSVGRLPNIRFVARFNPPLVVPWAVHVDILRRVGIEPRPEDFHATTFVGLALRPGELDPGMNPTTGDSTHEIKTSRSVLVQDSHGILKDAKHDMSLYMPKMEYSKTLESLPFSHPKQLIEILPTLRQFACTTSLLKDAFFEKLQKPKSAHIGQEDPLSPPLTPRIVQDEAQDSLQIDANLSYALPPRLTIHIPHPSSSKPAVGGFSEDLLSSLLSNASFSHTPINITVDVHANGELVVMEQNLIEVPALASTKDADVDMDKAQEVQDRVKRLGKALEICGDLGVWAEWLRREAGKVQDSK
ncbi:hypothetical protein ACN47E_000048 [Coniothyrium glycines]